MNAADGLVLSSVVEGLPDGAAGGRGGGVVPWLRRMRAGCARSWSTGARVSSSRVSDAAALAAAMARLACLRPRSATAMGRAAREHVCRAFRSAYRRGAVGRALPRVAGRGAPEIAANGCDQPFRARFRAAIRGGRPGARILDFGCGDGRVVEAGLRRRAGFLAARTCSTAAPRRARKPRGAGCSARPSAKSRMAASRFPTAHSTW